MALAAAKHTGVASCAGSQCHGSAVPRDGSGVLQNEYGTWTQDDPHSWAYQTLTTDRSTAIANRLGFKNAYTMKACLDCHTDNVKSGKRGERYQVTDGVGCEACHGGAEIWLSTHYNTPTVNHSDNLQAGLYPAEKPRDRAELCLSCHLGTKDKFASHRIMAAGHPRLAFELDTFTELWRTAGRQPHYRVDADYSERKDAASHVYTWATGLLAELDAVFAAIQKTGSEQILQRNQSAILSEILRSGAAGEFLDYASAEQAFMAVQMLSFELNDTALQDEIDTLAQSLENDERYRPSQFAHLLRQLDHIQ